MDLKAEVAIISIFGRGHWLAVELARAHVPVTLLDVSRQMGDWKPEDAEGPFGYFESEGSYIERLTADEQSLEVEKGMTLWLQDGPLECRGPTGAYRLAQLGLDPLATRYIQENLNSNQLRNLNFKQSWLAHFSHALTSSVSTLAPESIKEGLKRNLFLPFFVRQVTDQGLEKSLKWCESQGVKVLRDVELKDLSFEEGKKLGSFEVRTDRPGLFKAEQFVVCLTAEECGMLGSKIQSAIFGQQVHEPEWAWVRFRIQFQSEGPVSHLTRDQIPQHCIVIDDLMLPWTHENFLVLQKVSKLKDHFDAWMKIPNAQRFHSQYLQERAKQIKQMLEARVPENQVLLVDLPIEAGSTFQQIGPARHPIFSRALRVLRKKLQVKNVILDSPENWNSLSWEGQFEHQRKIFEVLKAWWDRKEEIRLKREAKEAAKLKRRGVEK